MLSSLSMLVMRIRQSTAYRDLFAVTQVGAPNANAHCVQRRPYHVVTPQICRIECGPYWTQFVCRVWVKANKY